MPEEPEFRFQFMGPLSFQEMMSHVIEQSEPYQQAEAAGKAAILAVMKEQYVQISTDAIHYDHFLYDDSETPTLEDAAKAWTLHTTAAYLAGRLATGLGQPHEAAEFKAQRREHQAANERWAYRLAKIAAEQFRPKH